MVNDPLVRTASPHLAHTCRPISDRGVLRVCDAAEVPLHLPLQVRPVIRGCACARAAADGRFEVSKVNRGTVYSLVILDGQQGRRDTSGKREDGERIELRARYIVLPCPCCRNSTGVLTPTSFSEGSSVPTTTSRINDQHLPTSMLLATSSRWVNASQRYTFQDTLSREALGPGFVYIPLRVFNRALVAPETILHFTQWCLRIRRLPYNIPKDSHPPLTRQ